MKVERSCISCREKSEKKYLNRYVLVDSDIMLDQSGRMPGRGVYLCSKCIDSFDETNKKLIHKMAFQLTKKTHNGKKNSIQRNKKE